MLVAECQRLEIHERLQPTFSCFPSPWRPRGLVNTYYSRILNDNTDDDDDLRVRHIERVSDTRCHSRARLSLEVESSRLRVAITIIDLEVIYRIVHLQHCGMVHKGNIHKSLDLGIRSWNKPSIRLRIGFKRNHQVLVRMQRDLNMWLYPELGRLWSMRFISQLRRLSVWWHWLLECSCTMLWRTPSGWVLHTTFTVVFLVTDRTTARWRGSCCTLSSTSRARRSQEPTDC